MEQKTIQQQRDWGLEDSDNPGLEEIVEYISNVIRHSFTVEYYLTKLQIIIDDGQHPHDITGEGNKLEWLVIRGLALKIRNTPEKQKRYLEAIEIHRRGQSHHQKWNNPNQEAREEDLKYGAIDAIVSLRESRDYQGGVHGWGEIREIIEQNPTHKRVWLSWALENIKYLEERGSGYRG